MPLLPTARQPEAPPAGSRNPFEQGLTSPLGAIQAGEARTRIGLAGQAGSAVSRAALQTADAVERIESSKRAIAIQTQLSDMNEQVAAANEVGELAGFDPSVESVVMPHFQGFDFNPAPMIQRFGPQIARSRLVLEDKRRALIRRDMDATMEASRGAAIREGNIGSLEAHVELVANNGDIFGNAVAKQMAEDEAKIVAEGIITKEIAESETAADAYIDILRDEGLAAEDPLVSLLPAERRLALLNTAVGSRAFKRRERMVEDEKAILAELDWAIHRGAINQETPALMARFGQVVGHENLLPVIDAVGPPESATFGLVEQGGDSTITAVQPWMTRRIRAIEAAERAAGTSSKIFDPRPHIERVPGARTPVPSDPKWDKGIKRYMDQEAAADGYADYFAFHYNAPLPQVQAKIAQMTSVQDGGGRVPLPSPVVQQLHNDMLSGVEERTTRAAVALLEAQRHSTRFYARKKYDDNSKVNGALEFWKSRARFVGADQATTELREAMATSTDFSVDSSAAARQVETMGGEEMVREHLASLSGEYAPPFFSEPGAATGAAIGRLMESKDQWNLWTANQSVGLRVFGTAGTYGPIILPDTGEASTIGQELGTSIRDLWTDPFWDETVRNIRAARFDNMTADLDDFEPNFTQEMVDDYNDILQNIVRAGQHFGDEDTMLALADKEWQKIYGTSRMSPTGIPQLVEFPPERQWAATGGAPGTLGAVQMQIHLANEISQSKGYPVDPSMVGLAIESGSVGTNPETGLREYYVKIALPTGSGEVRWALLKDPLGNLVTYSPDFADTRGLRAELDSERGGIAETALDILTATPALSFARDVLTGDQRRQMRDVFPELDEGGQGAAFLMQALKIFQLPQMIPELLEMEDGEIQDIQRPLDPGESAQQRWMRSHLPQGAEAEMRLGRERGRQVSEGVQPGASRDQVSALAESLGINADPRFFELLEQLGSGALPGTGQARPKQLDPRGP